MRHNLNEIQNVIKKHDYHIETIIIEVAKKFKFKTQCNKLGIKKLYGYKISEIVTLMVLLPIMLLNSINELYRSQYSKMANMKKDVLYRLKNSENVTWRRLLYLIVKRFKYLLKDSSSNECSCFIVDVHQLLSRVIKLKKCH